MIKHLFFITSVKEAKTTISRINKLKKGKTHYTVVSSDPLANIFLKSQKIKFSDIGNYYPSPDWVYKGKKWLSLSMKEWELDKKISETLLNKNKIKLNPLIGYSLNALLAEIIHSMMTAEKILKIIKPNVVHLSPRWAESPFRRYQSEKLNLENISIFRLSKQQHLRIIVFPTPINEYLISHLFSFLISSLWQTLRTTYIQLFHPVILPKSKQLTILANYYQLENLIPILEILKKNGKKVNIIGKISSSQHKKIIHSTPFFTHLETFEGMSKRFFDIRLIRTIKSILKFVALLPYIRKFFIFNNQNFWQFLFHKFIYYFVSEFPLFMDYIDGATKIFKRKTKLLVTPATADNVSRVIVAAAKNAKVPVLELQHGVLPKNDDDLNFRSNDFFAVWGIGMRETISDTRHPEKIPVTGYSHFDHYWYPRPLVINTQTFRNKLTGSPQKKVLLILSVFPSGITRIYPDHSPYQFMEMIFDIITKSKNEWKVIFRPHPSAPSSWTIPLAKNLNIDFLYDQQKYKLENVIAASDAIVANPSTTVLEAMFQNKPIFLYDFPSNSRAYKLSWWPMVATNSVKTFKTKAQLDELINKSIYNQAFLKDMNRKQQLFLKNYCSAHSKPATTRVISLINKLSNNKN